MDFSPIYQQLTGFLWYLIPLAVIGGLIKSPWFKGKAGEFLVNASARLFLDPEDLPIQPQVPEPTSSELQACKSHAGAAWVGRPPDAFSGGVCW